MAEVIRVSGSEEYFAEDRDQVHCKHGTYIGYPVGPDFMCGACENGQDTLIHGIQATLEIRIKDGVSGDWSPWFKADHVWDVGNIGKFDTVLGICEASPKTVEHRITETPYAYWGTEDEV